MLRSVRLSLIALALAFLACTPTPRPGDAPSTPAEAGGPAVQRNPAVAPPGKVLMVVGQDAETLRRYRKDVPSPEPGGITLYTSLTQDDPTTEVRPPSNAATGSPGFGPSLAESPHSALAVGLYLTDTPACESRHLRWIASGEADDAIDTFVRSLADLAPRPVYLRIGYEFDGPWNCYQPELYRAAFRHLVTRLEAVGAANVATVWQSAAWPDPGIAGADANRYDLSRPGFLDRWYPGDDVVDWVGVSIFYNDTRRWAYTPPHDPRKLQDLVLDFARAHNKPVFVAEAAPQGMDLRARTISPPQANDPEPATDQALWDGWFAPFFAYVRENADVIRAVAYINTDWASQAMWQCEPGVPAGQPGCANGNWGNSAVQDNPYILERWRTELADPLWLHGSPALFGTLGSATSGRE